MAGTPEQQARWFPDLAAGRALAAFAPTESEAGSDAAAIRTRAVRDGEGWRIDGAKRFISQGNVARCVTVFAVTDPSPEAVRSKRHISCFVVEQGTPGFTTVRLEHKMGIRGSTPPHRLFKDITVPD